MSNIVEWRQSSRAKRRLARLLLTTCLSPVLFPLFVSNAAADCVEQAPAGSRNYLCSGTDGGPIDINTNVDPGSDTIRTGGTYNATVNSPDYAIAVRNTGGNVDFQDTNESTFINNSTDSLSDVILIRNDNGANATTTFRTNGTVIGEVEIHNTSTASGIANLLVDMPNGTESSAAGALNLRNTSVGGAANSTMTVGSLNSTDVAFLLENFANLTAGKTGSGDAITNVTINGNVITTNSDVPVGAGRGVQIDNRATVANNGPSRNATVTLNVNGNIDSMHHALEVVNEAGFDNDVPKEGGGVVTTNITVTGDIISRERYGILNYGGTKFENNPDLISHDASRSAISIKANAIDAAQTGLRNFVGAAGNVITSVEVGTITAGERGIDNAVDSQVGNIDSTVTVNGDVSSAGGFAIRSLTTTETGNSQNKVTVSGNVAVTSLADDVAALHLESTSNGGAALSELNVAGSVTANGAGARGIYIENSTATQSNIALNIFGVSSDGDAITLINNHDNTTSAPALIQTTTTGSISSSSGTGIRMVGQHADEYLTVNQTIHGGGGQAVYMARQDVADGAASQGDSFNRSATLELRPGYALDGAAVALALNEEGSSSYFVKGNSHLVLGGAGSAAFDLSRINNKADALTSGATNRISGFGTLTKNDSSVWTLSNENTADPLDAFLYANVNAGTLSLDNATLALTKDAPNPYLLSSDAAPTMSPTHASGALTIASGAILEVHGASTVLGDVANKGSVVLNPCPTCAGNTLTVSGDYIGTAGSVVSIGTVLGDDNSATDKLIVNGNTAGSSLVRVTNENGSGAQTVEGIEIISVGGASDGVFTLEGDYVVAGAYTYRLHKNNGSGTDPNDWYLRSALTNQPEFHVGAPVYETYPQALLGLNGLNTLQQRVGNRFWAGSGNRVIAEGADAIVPYAAPEEAGVHVDGNGVWGRIEGSHNSIDPRFSTTGTEYRQNTFKLQAGVDGLLTENENGTLIGGIFVQYVHGKTKTNSGNYADGEISTDGYGFGGTLTWYGNEGFYIDSQAQVTWYDSDLTTSAFGAPTLTDGNNGIGYALSLETGKRFAIDPEWSITPQAQLVYSSVDFDDFTDGFGSHISLDRGDSLQGRLGITLDHENSWQNAKGMMNRSHVYGIANLYYEFLEGTKVNIEDVSFASKKDRLWGGIGVGGSYNWDNDKYSIYGEGIVNTSLNNFGDSYSLKGNVGFRVKW